MNVLKTSISFAVIFIIASIGAGVSKAEETVQVLTAKKAVEFALRNNPDITLGIQRIEQAKAIAAEVKSVDYPLVNLHAAYSQTNNPMYSFGNILNQSAFDNSINFNDPGRTDNLQLQASVQYRLYNGGRDRANMRAADAGIDISKINLEEVHRSLGFEVVKSFQAILQAGKMVDVRSQALDAIEASATVGRARFEAGDLLKQDLLNLELQIARASENLINAKHDLELTKRSFLNLLGLQEQEIVIDDSRDSTQAPPEVLDYSNHSEMTRIGFMEQTAAAALEKAEGAQNPTVDSFASYQWDKGWENNGDGDSWLAGVRLNYNLFDGYSTRATIRAAQSRLKEIAALRQKTELHLGLELEKARLNYQQARERLGVTEKMVSVAQEATRLSRVRFKEGVILASDLIDFEMRLTDAKARSLSAGAAYQVAIANLIRAVGKNQFPDE